MSGEETVNMLLGWILEAVGQYQTCDGLAGNDDGRAPERRQSRGHAFAATALWSLQMYSIVHAAVSYLDEYLME